jgi:glycosyltransferase involved in cell wall biosynthesis
MRVLLANKYFFNKGGAETYLFSVANLLKKHGHQVDFFSMQHSKNFSTPSQKYFVKYWDNQNHSLLNIIAASTRLLYSYEAKQKINQLLKDCQPDIVHLNNIYHQLSPSIIHTLKKARIPMVMTIHDLKLVCPAYSMFVNEEVCESCKNKRFYFCTVKKCVKNSRLKSLLGTLEMYLHHSFLHIYNLINIFISPSQFIKNKLIECGFKGNIVHLPNFVLLDQFIPDYRWKQPSIVYFGRLMRDKGLITLVDAVKSIDNIELKIIGDGPLKNYLIRKIQDENIHNVRLLGYLNGDDLHNEIRDSMFTVVPSELYENNPLAVIEAFALGKPVIGSNIGGIPELVLDNKTGFTFEPGNAEDLRLKIHTLKNNPDLIVQMGINARKFVENNLSAETYYHKLESIYHRVLRSCS